MAFWLARSRRGQDSDHIQRFDPRFWTVNFPRPMMASVTSISPDTMRVVCDFQRQGDLAGLIWDSVDSLDHPLLAYAQDRDYRRTTLRFRWQSSGLIALDQANGPTLTIEGRDAAGVARSWFVRLWNYAEGTPADARITLPFSALEAGWALPGEPVHPSAIDRMFISLVPPGHVPGSTAPLSAPVGGIAILSEIVCEGERAMLEIGDVMLPPHGEHAATGYDDGYNQNPLRLLRGLRGLGYRGPLLHYAGMSHFFRLVAGSGGDAGRLVASGDGMLAASAVRWHRAFFEGCKAMGYEAIISLSYELLADHCPLAWQQRAHDGEAARTGWDPPSALLSPAHAAAMGWLQAAARNLVGLQTQAGLAPRFQIGEPWWWVTADRKPCLYDAASAAALGGNPPVIAAMDAPLDTAQLSLLDAAGALLAQSTSALAGAVRGKGGPQTQVYLLAFTPTVLDPSMPELARANMPMGWTWPAFDRLQLEDYDWLTSGADSRRRAAYALVDARLGYPLDRQDYLSGFVVEPANADHHWRAIDCGLDEAAARGIARRFVWAMPQIARDGYTRLALPPGDDAMQAFDDVLYPLALGRDASVSPEFSTSVAVGVSGHERRASRWSDARLGFDVGPGIRSEAELGVLLDFFRARRGAARGFRLADPFDCSSSGMTGTPDAMDQLLGSGDGVTSSFALVKRYGEGVLGEDEAQLRRITRPRPGSVTVSLDGTAVSNWVLEEHGRIIFADAPPAGAQVRAGFLFDVPVRFAQDRLDISGASFAAGEAPSVPLIELREAP